MSVIRNFTIVNTTGIEVVDQPDKLILRAIKNSACSFTIRFTDKAVAGDLTETPQAKQVGLLSTAPADSLVPTEWDTGADIYGITGLDISSTDNPNPTPAGLAVYQDLVISGTPTDLASNQVLYIAGLGYSNIWYYTTIGTNTVEPFKPIVLYVVNPRPSLNIGNPDGTTVTLLPSGSFNQNYLPSNSPTGYTFSITEGNGNITWQLPKNVPLIPDLIFTVAPDTLSANLSGKFSTTTTFLASSLATSAATSTAGNPAFEILLSDEVFTQPTLYKYQIPIATAQNTVEITPATSDAFSSALAPIPTGIEYDSRIAAGKAVYLNAVNTTDYTWKVNGSTVTTSVSLGNGLSVYKDGTTKQLYVKGTPSESLNGKTITFTTAILETTSDYITPPTTYTLQFAPFTFAITPTSLPEIEAGLAYDTGTHIAYTGAIVRGSVSTMTWSIENYSDWPLGLKLRKNADNATYLDPTHLTPIVCTANTDYLALYGTAGVTRTTPYTFTLVGTYTEGSYTKQVKQTYKVKINATGILLAVPATDTQIIEIPKYSNAVTVTNILKAYGSATYAWAVDPLASTGITLAAGSGTVNSVEVAQQKTAGYFYFDVAVSGVATDPLVATNRYFVRVKDRPFPLTITKRLLPTTVTATSFPPVPIRHELYNLEAGQTVTWDLTDFSKWPPGLKLIKNVDNTTYLDATHNTPLVFSVNTDYLSLYGTAGTPSSTPYQFTVRCIIKDGATVLATVTHTYKLEISYF